MLINQFRLFSSPEALRTIPRARTLISCGLFVAVTLLSMPLVAQEGSAPFTISTSYHNLLSNADGTGMLDRIIVDALGRCGIEAQIVFTETDRSLVDVNTGILDAEMNRIEGIDAEYPNLIRVPEPNMTMEFVAFATRDYEIDGWESIRELDVGIVRGWKILETHTEGFPNLHFVPTEAELFEMLQRDRIDVALYARLTGYAALAEMGIEGVHHLTPPLASREMFLYVHRTHAELVADIAEALRSQKRDGTYQAIVDDTLKRYLPRPAGGRP